MTSKLLSILIPVYKTEKYIVRCLDSILMNKDGNENLFEIIIADDGSPDMSGAICDEYAKRMPDMIFVYHKKNEGAGATRNFLLEHANGDYIWFVDSDDYIEDGSVKNIHDVIIKNSEVEIITMSFKRFNNKCYGNKENIAEQRGLISGKDFILRNYRNGYLWNNIYSMSFLNKNNVRFNADLNNQEDWLFNLHAIIPCQKMLLTDIYAYNYYEANMNSTMRNRSLSNLERNYNNTIVAEKELKALIHKQADKDIKQPLEKILWLNISGFLYAMMVSCYPVEKIKLMLKELHDLDFYPVYNNTSNKKANIFLKIANIQFLYLLMCKLYSLVYNSRK
jgi:glycosyltransferase involved in cell wall biosynthesis